MLAQHLKKLDLSAECNEASPRVIASPPRGSTMSLRPRNLCAPIQPIHYSQPFTLIWKTVFHTCWPRGRHLVRPSCGDLAHYAGGKGRWSRHPCGVNGRELATESCRTLLPRRQSRRSGPTHCAVPRRRYQLSQLLVDAPQSEVQFLSTWAHEGARTLQRSQAGAESPSTH